jgi:DNA-directed RNA polymerase subunit E'/Rpb7
MTSKSESKISMPKKKILNNIFIPTILSKNLNIKFIEVDQNIKDKLKNILSKILEGKCNIDGYIKKDSIKIISYSCGILKGNSIEFNVIFECLVCHPVEGMLINCVVKDITKAGIRAELPNDDKTLVIFVARDHHYNSQKFSSIKVGEDIRVKVLGQRYELNDNFISVIAELVNTKELIELSKKETIKKSKPKLIFKE